VSEIDLKISIDYFFKIEIRALSGTKKALKFLLKAILSKNS
jgi:hypothetical protein